VPWWFITVSPRFIETGDGGEIASPRGTPLLFNIHALFRPEFLSTSKKAKIMVGP